MQQKLRRKKLLKTLKKFILHLKKEIASLHRDEFNENIKERTLFINMQINTLI